MEKYGCETKKFMAHTTLAFQMELKTSDNAVFIASWHKQWRMIQHYFQMSMTRWLSCAPPGSGTGRCLVVNKNL
jgi:hypothetical protein